MESIVASQGKPRPRILPLQEGSIYLGVFLPNVSSAYWFTAAASSATWEYPYNRAVTLAAEEAGFHFALPAARWRGIPGDRMNWSGTSLDTITLSGALLEATSRIAVFATIHSAMFPAPIAAKFCADLDQISNGRFGLNIVSGWLQEEFDALGIPLQSRKDRYAYTREWLKVVTALWRDGEMSFEGESIKVTNAVARPLPVQSPRPLIVNAGQSYTGMKFAAEEVDYIFSYGRNAAKFRDLAGSIKSNCGFIGTQRVIIGRTDAEAEEKRLRILEGSDKGASRNMLLASGAMTEDKVDEWLATDDNLHEFVLDGALVGSPETVADKIARLAQSEKPDALALTFFDTLDDLNLFNREALPALKSLLKESGMRVADAPAGDR